MIADLKQRVYEVTEVRMPYATVRAAKLFFIVDCYGKNTFDYCRYDLLGRTNNYNLDDWKFLRKVAESISELEGKSETDIAATAKR
ncbi:hypothetical protein LCGC14_2693000 [marine sediment metagenome]|uniref:Uncharacterized protein n=1 Tax=marine sediment metagenome TaxID=412755 RepID=A0A0F9A5H1_9ZZZZ